MAFTNITTRGVETGSAILTRVRLALVDVFLALTACISLWTTAEEITIGCVTEFIYGASSPIMTRINWKEKTLTYTVIFHFQH